MELSRLNKSQIYIVYGIILVLCVAVVSQITSIVNFFLHPAIVKEELHKENLKLVAFETIDKALESPVHTERIVFSKSAITPFRYPAGRQESPQLEAATPVVRELVLKGILRSKDPLAVIADPEGKTYICKQGDSIDGRVIFRIENDKVSIKFQNRITFLEVKEK